MKKYKTGYNYVIVFGITFLILLIAMKTTHFSNTYFGISDANVQYLDVFSYFKDVIEGKNNVSYTFTKSLGDSNIGVFLSMLTSPLHWLVVFFEKSNMYNFMNLLILIKLPLSALTFSIFLRYRFYDRIKLFTHNLVIIVVSISYGLCQYTLIQAHNTMWLEGVYILPLIMLGVYKVVNGKKSILLSISVALTIILNWYTGCFNCMFSLFWLVVEVALLLASEGKLITNKIKQIFLIIVRYGYAMLIGLGIGFIVLSPLLISFQTTGVGKLEWGLFKNVSLLGNVYNAIESYSMGARSSLGNVSLYAGSIILIGCIALFFNKKINIQKKIILGSSIVIILLIYYWNPFFVLFSMIRGCETMFYRYGYLGIATIAFIGAYSFLYITRPVKEWLFAKIGIVFAILLVVIHFINPVNSHINVIISAIFIVIISFAISLLLLSKKNQKWKKVMLTVILGVFLSETIISTIFFMEYSSFGNPDTYKTYVDNQDKQIKQLKDCDDESYRIHQLTTRNMKFLNTTSNYNEPMAFNYWSISEYTSNPNSAQMNLLDKLGYNRFDVRMCCTTEPIITADSFLGVKYLLSNYNISELEEYKKVKPTNGKTVYYNKYVLPFAFSIKYSSSLNPIYKENSFEYQNDVYSFLLGEDTKLYKKIIYKKVMTKDGVQYEIKQSNKNYMYFGNIPTIDDMNGILCIKGRSDVTYSQRRAPSVFYIPNNTNNKKIKVIFKTNNKDKIKKDQEQFYALDLREYRRIVEKIENKKADVVVKNGYARIKKYSKEKENIFLSIPYDEGWEVKVNGKPVNAKRFADTFMLVTVNEGKNVIETKYHVRGVKTGIIVMISSVIILLIILFLEKSYYNKKMRIDKK